VAYLCGRAAGGGAADPDALLVEGLPDGARRRLSAGVVLADVSPEEARRRYPEMLLSLRTAKARREVEELQGKVKEASGEAAEELFARVLAAKKELERLLWSRRSR